MKKATKDEISQELFGCNFNSVNLTRLQRMIVESHLGDWDAIKWRIDNISEIKNES